MSKEPVFVGIDPGTTSAVAVIDFHGEVNGFTSAKNFSKDRIIRFIIDHGRPVFIASDKAQTPSLIAEIAGNMGADIITPDNDLSAAEKDEYIDTYDIDPGDDHCLDAIAAAGYAYNTYRHKLDRIRDRLASEDLDDAFESAAARIIGDGIATGTVIADLTAPDRQEQEHTEEPREETDWEQVAATRADRIKLLAQKVEHLQEYVTQLEADTADRKTENDAAVTEAELRERNKRLKELRAERDRKDARIERLEDENETLEAAMTKMRSGWRFIPAYQDAASVSEDTAFVSRIGDEVPDQVDALIVENHVPRIDGVRIIRLSELDHIRLDDGLLVPPNALNSAVGEEFTEWLQTYRERRSGA